MARELPLVSVVVPAYNAAATIGVCVESLLHQTYPKERYEIIIVDNNSKDDTAGVLAGYPVRTLSERRRQSSYAARNCGIQASRGELIAFTDSDCIAEPTWLERLVEGSEEASIGAFAGRVLAHQPVTVLEQFAERRRQVSQDASMACRFLPYAITANVAYRRELLAALGGFEEALISGGDAALSWRLQLEQGNTIRFNREAVVHHKHRSTFRSFWRQHRLYGYGTSMLYARFSGYRKSLAYETWYGARRVARFFFRGLSRLIRYPFKRKEPAVYFAEHFLEVLCTISRWTGLVKGWGAPSGGGVPLRVSPSTAVTVSVIIPAYNREQLIGPTLESVLAQTYTDYEVLVVDDGSTDGTRAVAESYVQKFRGRLRCISQPNQGLSAARNTGCRAAAGRLLAFLDSDDLWKPEKLALQVPAIDADPSIGLVSSMAEVVDAQNTRVLRIKPEQRPGTTLRELIDRGTAPPSTFLARREAMEQVGGFDAAITKGLEDLDLGFRLAAAGWKLVCLEQPLIRYRMHETNISSEPVGTYRGYAQAYGKLLAHRQVDIPRAQVRRLAAKYRYLYGTALLRQGSFAAALGELWRAVRIWPLVGLSFRRPDGPWWQSGMLVMKPYAALCGLGVSCLMNGRKS